MTDHSLASRNGITIRPTFVCRPWLSAYSQLGEVGQSNVNGKSRSAGTIALPGRSGMYAMWLKKPVVATIATSTSRIVPRMPVRTGPRIGERKKPVAERSGRGLAKQFGWHGSLVPTDA